MPRIFRLLPEEGCLHILTRGNNRQAIFHDDKDYDAHLNFIKRYKQESKIKVYHYCIMPNHAHLIVEINPRSTLSKFIKQLNLAYLYYYKKRYKYDGHLWQGRYKSLIISKDEYLIACARYIELNPVKAKIVKDPKEYPYSSYNTYAYGKKDDVVEYDPVYLELGKQDKQRQQNYRKDIITEETERLSFNLNARFLGPRDFISHMESKFQVSNLKAERGRPVKV